MITLGISCYYHDSAAVLLKDGALLAAAQEERFTRKKHDNGFPSHAIRFCLDWAQLNASDIDCVAFYEKPILKFERVLFQHLQHFPKSIRTFDQSFGSWFSYRLNIPKTLKNEFGYVGRIAYVPHHVSHAAAAYYPSGFDRAVILTVDGVGEWATTTVGMGKGNDIRIDREIRFPHSLGLLYSTITTYLGFEANDAEYKVMGLAAYGDPEPFMPQFERLLRFHADGSYSLSMEYFDYTWSDQMFSGRLERLFGFPARKPESPMERQYENIAASLQKTIENIVFSMLTAAHKSYHTDALCLAGGVALNSVLNGKILSHTPFKHLSIPPDPGDGGGALGAALYVSATATGKRPGTCFQPALGPSYTDDQIRTVLDTYPYGFTQYDTEDTLIDAVAALLAKKRIIGWFQGRMEWGPRALGHRSILASASTSDMKDIINSRVKHRELFRPFAPAILDRSVNAYFKADKPLPDSASYMLLVYPFTAKGVREVPATVHVDNTGRLQAVSRDQNPRYYDLIERYGKITGVPVIINTSFNVRGEPIVCTPKDAIECFRKTDIEYLVIGNYVVRKGKK